jgi:hypothetical protein
MPVIHVNQKSWRISVYSDDVCVHITTMESFNIYKAQLAPYNKIMEFNSLIPELSVEYSDCEFLLQDPDGYLLRFNN